MSIMAYRYTNSRDQSFFLNKREVSLSGGPQTFYYFSAEERADTGCDLPNKREVVENPVNGFPVLILKRPWPVRLWLRYGPPALIRKLRGTRTD